MDSYDLQINQGETFNLSIGLKDGDGNPLDLTGNIISGFLKFRYSDPVTDKLTDLNATILSIPSGIIGLTIPATGTAHLPITIGVYDVEMTATGDGTVVKILRGNAYVNPEVTF